MNVVGNAMNTIPLTFNEHQISRTVIGGRENNSENTLNISVILLNGSGSQFKVNIFENLLQCNFRSVVSVEHDAQNRSIDDIAKKYPAVKFIVPLEKATDGELINLAMSEVDADYVLVLRDNLYIPSGIILPNLAERLIKDDYYCVVPRLLDQNKNGIPTQFIPGVEKKHFTVEEIASITDGTKTIFPFDYIALYNRKKFIQLGGFDYTIQSPYWQNLDLGLRSWLWGEQTRLTTMLHFSYVDEIPLVEKNFNLDYLRYHLKNEMPKFKNDRAYLSFFSFFTFRNHSSCGFLEARRQHQDAKKWIEQNKYKFKMDLTYFIENWSSL